MTKKIKLKISARLVKKRFRKNSGPKHCRFCSSTEQEQALDYKNSPLLKSFLTERGKILPSRISGNCARHQRSMARSIRKSRIMALLPYAAGQF